MKALLDTNVLIDFFRNPNHKEEFEARTLRPQFYMSSVVALELYAGCRDKHEQDELASFLKPFETAGRIVTPDHACFLECGRVLAKLAQRGMGVAQRRQISNDVLIALSATRVGAIVVTANIRDFALIAEHSTVRWMVPK